MSWLLKYLAGAAGPYILGGAGVVLLALLATIGALGWEIKGLHTDVAKAETSVAEAKTETAEVREELERESGNRQRLQDATDFQNSEIDRLQAECKASADTAVASALRALNRPKPDAVKTAEEFNAWIIDRFAPPR